jgi:hypothetical protein
MAIAKKVNIYETLKFSQFFPMEAVETESASNLLPEKVP